MVFLLSFIYNLILPNCYTKSSFFFRKALSFHLVITCDEMEEGTEKSVFPSLLEIVDVPTNDGFRDLIHINNVQLLPAPAFKEQKRLFV